MSDLTPDMQAKRAALAAAVRELVEPHLPASHTLTVETRIRKALLGGADARDRRRIMGDPICYVRIAYEGPGGPGSQSVNAGDVPGAHRFRVMLWLEYEDADTHAGSSEALFDDVLEGTDTDDGLWDGLREAGYLETGAGEAVELGFEGAEPPTLVAIKPRVSLYAHFGECVVTIS